MGISSMFCIVYSAGEYSSLIRDNTEFINRQKAQSKTLDSVPMTNHPSRCSGVNISTLVSADKFSRLKVSSFDLKRSVVIYFNSIYIFGVNQISKLNKNAFQYTLQEEHTFLTDSKIVL